MSLWQFAACVAGVNASRGGDTRPDPMSADEYDELVARHADWII